MPINHVISSFDYVHWQIVNKGKFNNTEKFIGKYKQNLHCLFNNWLKALSFGIVLNIIPFNRIVRSLLLNETLISFRCGCGSSIQAIDVDGNIYATNIYRLSLKKILGHIANSLEY